MAPKETKYLTPGETNEHGFTAEELQDEGFDCHTLGYIAAAPAEIWRGPDDASDPEAQVRINIAETLSRLDDMEFLPKIG